MLTIRFARVGRKNKAQFRIVVQEHTLAPTGRHVEVLGSYDPHQKKAVLKAEKIQEWIKKGAQVSDTAYNLFVKEGVIQGKKRSVKIEKPAAVVVEEVAAPTVEVNPPAGVEEVAAPTEEVKAA